MIYFKETKLHKFIMLNDDTKCKIQTEEEKEEIDVCITINW
jgi:hypothetical protein